MKSGVLMINLFVKVFLYNKIYSSICVEPLRELLGRFSKEKDNKSLV